MFGVYLLNFISMYIFLFKLATLFHFIIFIALMILPHIYGIWIEYTL